MTRLHVVMAGSSGFLGSHLREELERRGHRVTALVRRPTSRPRESSWDPYAGEVDDDLVASADVVVNLAGSPTAGNPHSKKWAEKLRTSRVTTTRVLAEAVARAPRPPAYLAGNGISWYGDHGPVPLTESSDSRGHALLTKVTRDWQHATAPASAADARVCVLRTAPVMDRANPPLKQMRLQFLVGLGGRLGSGRQHMPMISRRDWVGAVAFLAEHPTASGPVNLCCPTTPTNAEFTTALRRALHRPAVLPLAGPLIKVAGGAMAPELLGSLNVRPAVLIRLGYQFRDVDVDAVVASGLA